MKALTEPGVVAALLLGLLLTGFALAVDFPKAAFGFQSDEASYYTLGHSLAHDLDFQYRRDDLVRVWKEFPSGPQGIFLKRGSDGQIYYAKAYIYPLLAAPFHVIVPGDWDRFLP